MLLSRSHIALSYLDLASSSGSLTPARFYVAHVRILELEQRLGSKPLVVIARLDDGKSVYAIERYDKALYVLCRLGAWVDLDRLKDVSLVARHDVATRLSSGLGVPPQDISKSRSRDLITPDSQKYTRTKRLAIEAIQSKVKRPAITFPTADPGKEATAIPAETMPEAVSLTSAEEARRTEINSAQSTSADLLATVRAQYFEALYLSRVGLLHY